MARVRAGEVGATATIAAIATATGAGGVGIVRVSGPRSRELALALTGMMNQLGAEGWDYVRADTLPCEERSGLTGTKTSYQTVMVFRRALAASAAAGSGAEPVTPVRAEGPRLGSPVAMPAGPAPALGPAAAPASAPPAVAPSREATAP